MSSAATQLFARLALAIGFLSPVADRLGLWGPPGTPNVGWGDWSHFADYTHTLLFFLPASVSGVFAIVATAAELLFGLLLFLGLFTRLAAIGSGLLLLSFAFSMTVALGVHAPLNYSVFAAAAASFFLSTAPAYPWSVDAFKGGRPA